MYPQRTQERGVILIEAIVAIGVLSVMAVGALSLLSRSVNGLRNSTDRVVATYLAQDALEWVLARSRYNSASMLDWLDNLDTASCGTNCGIDTHAAISTGTFSSCGIDSCVLYRTSTGSYSHKGAGNTATPYRRTVTIAGSGFERTVTATVSWNSQSGTESLSLTLMLYES